MLFDYERLWRSYKTVETCHKQGRTGLGGQVAIATRAPYNFEKQAPPP